MSLAASVPLEHQLSEQDRILGGYYRDMLLIRRFEEKAGQLYGLGLIGGFCHLYIGQEAVAVGVMDALTDKDSTITSYRAHGHMLASGADPRFVMAELTGRRAGCSAGKGGSMHLFHLPKRFFGGHGIVGAQVPLGTGLAFGHKYQQDGGICACFLGDGAANQGQVYESFNMAALWQLPVLYVIENNKYAMGTSQQRSAAGGELYRRGEPYGIPGAQVQGMDVAEVQTATQQWGAYVRSGKGAAIVEVMTYRYRGHSMSDPAKYRTKEEVQQVRSNSDPIENLRRRLLERPTFNDDTLKDIDRSVKAMIKEAADFAQQSPEPEPAALCSDVSFAL